MIFRKEKIMKKIITIVAIVVAVALAATGITLAVVLNSNYIDGIKKYDVASEYSFNGVEILEEDGLYYLTRDGKKISKTGYSALSSVNEYYFYMNGEATLSTYEDLEFFDWYVARKPEAKTYFLVNTEGEEITVAGETLQYVGCFMPYITFIDITTQEMGAISLKSFDSALSSNAGSEITVNMFAEIEPNTVNSDQAMADYLVAYDKGDGTANEKCIFVDANGSKLFEAIGDVNSFAEYNVYDKENDKNIRYILTGLGELYNLKGDLVASDVTNIEEDPAEGEYIMVACAPEDESLTTEQNAENAYVVFVSAKTSFKLVAKEYDFTNSRFWGNLLYIGMKNADGTASQDSKLFNIMNGNNTICRYGATEVDANLVRVNANEEGTLYDYIDAETGVTLMQTKYSDMLWYADTNALYSGAENAERNVSAVDPAKANKAYLHFVAPGKTTAELTLAWNEVITSLVADDEAPSYLITSTNDVEAADPAAAYSIIKQSVYVPFGDGKVGAYDTVQYLEIFEDGLGVALATDYDGGKFDFIDVANGKIVKTVAAAEADMAKTTINYYKTYAIRQDNYVEESTAEFAVFYIAKADDSNQRANTEYFVLSRNTAMTDDDKLSTKAIISTDIGSNILSVFATEGQLVVNTTPRSSTLYTLNDSYTLEEVVSLDYAIVGVEYYDNDINSYYIKVYDELGNVGLYNISGDEILATVYNDIMVCDAEYFIVEDKGGYGAVKFKAKNGKVKQIIDCIYEDIYYLGEGGFEICEFDSYYLFDEGKKVKSDRLVDDSFAIYNYYIDEETGKLMCAYNPVFNYGGKLYIHRAEAEEVIRNTYYDYNAIYNDVDDTNEMNSYITINQSGVKVVNFRDTDGKIIETKVLYPTLKSQVEFVLTEAWYDTPVKKLQKHVITDVEVEAMSGNQVINLYKAHPTTTVLG